MKESMAQNVKRHCETIGRDGFDLSKGMLWQHKRVNARPFPLFIGKLLAERRHVLSETEQRLGIRGFQTDALYRYTDGSMLVVHRTINKTTLAATKGEQQ